MSAPYRSSPVFDETTLPDALKAEHRTKAGVWGLIKVLEGQLLLHLLDRHEDLILSPGRSAIVLPEQPHSVTPIGKMRMRVEFYNAPPDSEACEDGAVRD